MLKLETLFDASFNNWLNEPILRIGTELSYSRHTLVTRLGCGNWIAARRLDQSIRYLGLRSVDAIVRTDPVSIARRSGVGIAQIYVLTCLLEEQGVDVEKWWQWTRDRHYKFSSLKHLKVQRAKRREAKKGKA